MGVTFATMAMAIVYLYCRNIVMFLLYYHCIYPILFLLRCYNNLIMFGNTEKVMALIVHTVMKHIILEQNTR